MVRFQSLCLVPSVDCLHCVCTRSRAHQNFNRTVEKKEKQKRNISMQGQIGKSPIIWTHNVAEKICERVEFRTVRLLTARGMTGIFFSVYVHENYHNLTAWFRNASVMNKHNLKFQPPTPPLLLLLLPDKNVIVQLRFPNCLLCVCVVQLTANSFLNIYNFFSLSLLEHLLTPFRRLFLVPAVVSQFHLNACSINVNA